MSEFQTDGEKRVIPGVELIPLVTHVDERGYFREILKSSQITKFGQWSMSWMTHGIIKAFHIHRVQTDYWFVPSGVIKAVVVDCRRAKMEIGEKGECYPTNPVSPSESEDPIEYILGDNQEPKVLIIPPGIAHGLKVLQGPAVLMYITSEMYDPSDEGRIPYDSLGYNWDERIIK